MEVKMLHNIYRENAVNCVWKRRLTAVGPFSRNKSHLFYYTIMLLLLTINLLPCRLDFDFTLVNVLVSTLAFLFIAYFKVPKSEEKNHKQTCICKLDEIMLNTFFTQLCAKCIASVLSQVLWNYRNRWFSDKYTSYVGFSENFLYKS